MMEHSSPGRSPPLALPRRGRSRAHHQS